MTSCAGVEDALTRRGVCRLTSAVVDDLDRTVTALEEAVGERFPWPPVPQTAS